MEELWTAVDRYFTARLIPSDPTLDAALEANHVAGLAPIDVTPLQGSFLNLLVTLSGAKRILEIGTLGGYSTIWMARALPPDGELIALELVPENAEVARQNLVRAGITRGVTVRVGPALDSLAAMHAEGIAPFDFIFIDADKRTYPNYLDWALKFAHPGTVIVVDNLVRDGLVVDPACDDPDVEGMRQFAEKVAREPRLRSTLIQTVSAKRHDGFFLGVVQS